MYTEPRVLPQSPIST